MLLQDKAQMLVFCDLGPAEEVKKSSVKAAVGSGCYHGFEQSPCPVSGRKNPKNCRSPGLAQLYVASSFIGQPDHGYHKHHAALAAGLYPLCLGDTWVHTKWVHAHSYTHLQVQL